MTDYTKVPPSKVRQEAYKEGYEQGTADAFKEMLGKIDEGFCWDCEHWYEGCTHDCASGEYEKDELIKWLKGRIGSETKE